MTSATGIERGGFTLIEILVVVGLIALMATLVVANADALLRGFGPKPLPDTLRAAIREARYQAAYTKDTALLRFDASGGALVVESSSGASLAKFPTGYGPDAPRIDLRFYQVLPGRGTDPDSRAGRERIETVRFRPDRSSTPFIAEIRFEHDTTEYRFDPFSHVTIKAR
jgi:prepilin-type N-terminal cleavage/methylation domain-containing protein